MAESKKQDLTVQEQLAAKNHSADKTVASNTADESVPATNADAQNAQSAEPEKTAEDVPVELLAWAEQMDIGLDEAKALGTKALARMRDRLEGEIAEAHKTVTIGSTAKTEKFSVKLDDVDFTEGGQTVIMQLVDHINQQNEMIAKMKEGVETTIKAGRESRINALLDSAKEYEGVVGAGHSRGRARVLDQIAVLEAGYKATGKSVPPESVLVKTALVAVFPDYQTKLTSAKAVAKARDVAGQFISRPSQRNGAPKQGREAVLDEIRAIRERALSRG